MRFLKIELKRQLTSKSFWIALGLGLVIIILQQVTVNRFMFPYEKSAFMLVSGLDSSGVGKSFYYLLFPFIAALAGADLYGEDARNRMTENIIVRTGKKTYFLTKMGISFLIGGIAFLLPLITEMYLLAMFYPTIKLDIFISNSPVWPEDLFSNIFVLSPFLYWCIFIMFGILYAGVFSLIGFSASLYTRNKYVILLTPFFVYYSLWVIFSLLNLRELSPFGFLPPKQASSYIRLEVIVGELILFILIILIIFRNRIGKRKDELI